MSFRWSMILAIFLTIFIIGEVLAEGETSVSLTLEESIEIAMESNLSVYIVGKKIALAKEGVKLARSGYLPTIDLNLSYTQLERAPTTTIPEMTITVGTDPVTGEPIEITVPATTVEVGSEGQYSSQLSLSQTVYAGGRILATISQAKAGQDIAENEYIIAEQELILNVSRAYYGVLSAQQILKVAEDALEQMKAHVKSARALFDAGISSEYDVLRAEVQLASVKQDLTGAENELKLAKAVFNNALGRDLESEVDLAEELTYESLELDLDASLKMAYENRPEIKQLEASEKVNKAALKMAEGERLPSVILAGDYYWSDKVLPEDASWSVTLAASFNIYNGGATGAKINQAKVNLAQVEASKKQLLQGIALEVRQAYLKSEEAKERIEVSKVAVTQAEEGLRIAEIRYENGLAPSVEILDAQTALTQARTNYVQAMVDYKLAIIELKKAMGTLGR